MPQKDDDMPFEGGEMAADEAEYEDIGALEGEEAADMDMLGGEEAGLEGEMAYGSLEEGVMSLLGGWQPSPPEGEQYKSELQSLYDEMGAGEAEMGLEEGGMESVPTGDLAGIRNMAASRAFGGGGGGF